MVGGVGGEVSVSGGLGGGGQLGGWLDGLKSIKTQNQSGVTQFLWLTSKLPCSVCLLRKTGNGHCVNPHLWTWREDEEQKLLSSVWTREGGVRTGGRWSVGVGGNACECTMPCEWVGGSASVQG